MNILEVVVVVEYIGIVGTAHNSHYVNYYVIKGKVDEKVC